MSNTTAVGNKTLSPKPNWLKVKAPFGENYTSIKEMMRTLNIATVCQEARCPNMGECWGGGTATIMLMGDVCTRGCRFCAIKTGNPKGQLDQLEPEKVAYALSQLNLKYVVLTSVDRDDLSDGGANHFAQTVSTIKKFNPKMLIEVLTPDFCANEKHIALVVDSKPDVFAHNIETVKRLSPLVRDPRASYEKSLFVLESVKKIDSSRFTKSSIMLGLGEREDEIKQSLQDLKTVGCDVVTFGQYLQPSKRHLNVEEFITPERFKQLQVYAEEMGFLYVASGPLVRSSYRAGEYFMEGMIKNKISRSFK